MTTHSTLFHFHTSPSFPLSSSTTTTTTPHLHLSCSFKPKPHKPSSFSMAPTPIPARDTVIARLRQTQGALGQPRQSNAVYCDRIEWESAENALTGDRSNAGGVSELLGISDRFGWDNDDKVGWSKVNFELLGTSKGGRIPRKKSESEVREESGLERRERRMKMQREEDRVEKEEKLGIMEKVRGSLGNGVGLGKKISKENEDNWVVDGKKKFPGRESLLRKAYSRKFL